MPFNQERLDIPLRELRLPQFIFKTFDFWIANAHLTPNTTQPKKGKAMSFGSYSTTPASNTTIGGVNIAENCSPANVNDAIRQLMADGRSLFDTVDAIDLSAKASLDAPAFTGQPTYSGRGAFIHHNNSANASGRIFIQASGGSLPTMANGDILLEY